MFEIKYKQRLFNNESTIQIKKVYTGSFDKMIRGFELETGDCIKTLEGNTENILCISNLFGNRLISGSGEGALR